MAIKNIPNKIYKTYHSSGAIIVVLIVLIAAILFAVFSSYTKQNAPSQPLDISLRSENAGSIVKAQAGDCSISGSQIGLDSVEQQMVNIVNDYSQQNGLPRIPASYALSKTSAWMANSMATYRYVDHIDKLGRNYDVRLQDCGYNAFGADILGGDPSADPATILNRWKASPLHNIVILNQVSGINF